MWITSVIALLALSGVALSAAPCTSGLDCPPSEVCEVHYAGTGPIGRRQPVSIHGGVHSTCAALRHAGETCWVSGGTIKTVPTRVVQHAPCQVGLTCKGKHVFVVPDGEVGECR